MRVRFIIHAAAVILCPAISGPAALPFASAQGPVAASPPAGIAVVVGVDHYPALDDAAQLTGCVNDATRLGAVLTARGFTVTVLTNASRDAIRAALADAKTRGSSGVPFVFAFAGHGTSDGGNTGFILPADTDRDGTAHDIAATELETLVRAVPASSRTVFLDSCFSGAMMRSVKKQDKTVKTRYWSKARSGVRADGVAGGFRDSGSDQTSLSGSASLAFAAASDASICYFVAARPAEQAAEKRLGGEPRGVFTYCLLHVLGQSGSAALRWSDVQTAVAAEVAFSTGDQQHPALTPTFRGLNFLAPQSPTPAKTSGTANAGRVGERNLWGEYNTDNPNRAALRLIMSPDQSTNKKGERITLAVLAMQPGYLVVMERGTAGDINLIYPDESPVPVAAVAGQRITLGTFVADTEGDERIKAILFTDEESARAVLDAFPPPGADGRRTLPIAGARGRSLRKVRAAGGAPTFVTDDLHFEVVP